MRGAGWKVITKTACQNTFRIVLHIKNTSMDNFETLA